jgi:hypothetical protein
MSELPKRKFEDSSQAQKISFSALKLPFDKKAKKS